MLDGPRFRTVRKVLRALRRFGLTTTLAITASVIEDLYLRVFDRYYGVRTSGYIPLSETSLKQNHAVRGHRYRPVNAWAFKDLMRLLAPSKESRFLDLGCGLGRACLIAADYGFSRVRGVDFVSEFCLKAKENAEAFCRARGNKPTPIEIRLEDAVQYSKHSDDDIIFLYNPFPADVLRRVIDNLLEDAGAKMRPTMIIYTERIIETSRTLEVLTQHKSLAAILNYTAWGQSFHVFRPIWK